MEAALSASGGGNRLRLNNYSQCGWDLSPKIDVSIVIVSYNCLGPLKECLESIAAQDGVTYEVIVVDNASNDGTAQFLKDRKTRGAFLENNIGFGAGINLGQNEATGEFLFILNPDTILPSGTLQALYDFANNNENTGLLSPLIIWPDGETQRSARKLPTRVDFLFGRGSPLFKLGITGEKHAGYIQISDNKPLRVPAISATAAFLRTGLFRSLGGFDSRFFMYLEDIDLCKRVAEQKLDIWLLPQIKVIHGWRQSSSGRPYFASFHHHISVYKYFRKHYPRQPVRNFLLLTVLIFGFMISLLIIAFGRGRN